MKDTGFSFRFFCPPPRAFLRELTAAAGPVKLAAGPYSLRLIGRLRSRLRRRLVVRVRLRLPGQET
jgi:hypothetical protein